MNDLAPALTFPPDDGRAGRAGAAEAPRMEVREAATLILVRAGAAPLEVLMLRRHPESVFAADAWVFPGGQVDPADGAANLTALSRGRTDAQASAALGIPSGGLAFWVAAVRECFEEAGILLARPAAVTRDAESSRQEGFGFDVSVELDAARLVRHRRDLRTGRRTLAELLAAEGLVLDLDGIHYVSHWITPPGDSRRFDTRFFLAATPPAQVASHDAAETVESIWAAPAAVLGRHAAGDVHLVFPTIKTLETLARFDTVESLLAAARTIGPVPVSAPRFKGDPRTAPSALEGKIGGMRLQPPRDRSLHA
jgi:8-oxo-dGTP pyrophosphatase MutT (NUDIX family)